MKMRYCKRCLQPDTRPGIIFDDEQICFACRYEESKATIDWAAREAELRGFAEEAKAEAKKRGNIYDCIIGVSGGKDSTFQAVYAKEKLGLNPLLINCMPDEITEIGRKNINNLNNLGFDIISIRPNPIVAKKLARKSFFERGNIIAASEYCLWASSYIMAVKFNIPLIIQGENAALTLGAAKNQEATGNAFSVMQLETIRGASVDSFVDLSNNITEKDLFLYKIPTVEEMQAKGIKAIFLQYYTKEWSQVSNADFAVARGLTGRSGDLHDLGRYRRYTALDCDLQIPNQMIKYLKFGFGYATDEICYDIREGRFSREDGKWYVNEYDGLCGQQYIAKACKYLSITEAEFWEVVDKYVNRDLFEKVNGKWTPKFTVGEDYES
ncbi:MULTISPECIES: N-acetyl sugar amidotransferase [unclassified Butyrivibrio]|uniref:N-acetyl sugar amidotransferase n=1 Tax=unclassified Butyrivibrio TaxID=2639466 RepID=UPI0003B56BB1|nr:MULTISPECIES: N-acetyl sugar amidotransferase [unclassified Butyrivibrio]